MPCFHRLSMDLVHQKMSEIKVDSAALKVPTTIYGTPRATISVRLLCRYAQAVCAMLRSHHLHA